MIRLLLVCIVSFVSVSAQDRLPASLPASLQVPAGRNFLFQLHGKGVQVYACKDSWTLKAPEAELLDHEGAAIGRHFAGPTWELKDGSQVTGKAIANSPSPDSTSIPWLLIDVTRHAGDGKLNGVSTILRLNTKGGKAPSEGCDSAHSDAESRVAYEADYYFYGEGK